MEAGPESPPRNESLPKARLAEHGVDRDKLSRLERAPATLCGYLCADDRELFAEDMVSKRAWARNAVHAKRTRLPDRKVASEHIPDGRFEQQPMRLDASTRAPTVAIRVVEGEAVSAGEGIVKDTQKLARRRSGGPPHVVARRRPDDHPPAQRAQLARADRREAAQELRQSGTSCLVPRQIACFSRQASGEPERCDLGDRQMHGRCSAATLQTKSATAAWFPGDREAACAERSEIPEHGPPGHRELLGERADRGSILGMQQVGQHQEALGSRHLW
jgi:hypothetical protein